jgi:hypothetical protein
LIGTLVDWESEVDVETFPPIEIQNDLRILRLALEALESKMPGE